MSILKSALELARRGFHIFPLQPNGKLPAISEYPELASDKKKRIEAWWWDPVLEIVNPFNVGISCTHFKTDQALIVIDVDNKGKKHGSDELLNLELKGLDFPPTYTQETPTGGYHIFYSAPKAMRQGVDVLAPGLDIRSHGGYVVGMGSEIDGKFYTANDLEVATAPKWLVERLGVAKMKAELSIVGKVNRSAAVERAIHYLEKEAPVSLEGEGGDQTAFKVAARVKDFGVNANGCLDLMIMHWNERCAPAWNPSDLGEKVDHAYRYGSEPPGIAAPELQFSKIETHTHQPTLTSYEKLNLEYAFVVAGGGSHILWETTGSKGEFKLEHLSIDTFHKKFAAQTIVIADKRKSLTQAWMMSHARRSYDGIVFMPGLMAPKRFYNLWRGFSVEPQPVGKEPSKQATKSLDMFLDHARVNVCANDEALFIWLMGYFAHLIQRPYEKPLVALVFKGAKGVGKNALIERVGRLIEDCFMVTSDKRHLISNFNGHLENKLLMVLDEAFWSGDKQAEGILKNLITGRQHVIEHKGKEPYTVDNCTRVAILGNEDWLVPATQDERRFAVFEVGEGKKQNLSFFKNMREGMEAGGYSVLLRYFLDFDLARIDVNSAPSTKGLYEQKISSLAPIHQWWFECITEGRLVGSDFEHEWPTEVEKGRFRNSVRRFIRDRGSRWAPTDQVIGRLMKLCAPGIDTANKMKLGDGPRINCYRLPSLEQARQDWEKFIGHEAKWD